MERPGSGGDGGGYEFLLSPLHRAGAEPDRIYEYIRGLDKEKDALQDGRLLYVTSNDNPMAAAYHWEYTGPDSTAMRFRLRTALAVTAVTLCGATAVFLFAVP